MTSTVRTYRKLFQGINTGCFIFFLAFTLATSTLQAHTHGAQANSDERKKAMQLYDQNKFTEALPLLERLAAANPSDVLLISRFGFALYATTATITDPAARKQTRARARSVLLRANELGDNSLLTRVTLDALAANENGDLTFSKLQTAEKAMREGEAAFAQGDFNRALAAYDSALAADPGLYEAALFKGDVYFKSEQQEKAGECFARAIAINPDRETAYRYWGDSLMGQGKINEARDKFIEAYISEPYSQLARAGFTKWGEQARVTVAHPLIDIPANVSQQEKGKVTLNLDPKTLSNDDQDGSAAWITYGIIRAAWATTNFAREYPNEKVYRHSLREEAAALRGVVEALANQLKAKKIPKINPSLENLLRLHGDDLLEPYILLARPDQGIAQDFPDFRRAHRDKLRRYVVEYVVGGKTASF